MTNTITINTTFLGSLVLSAARHAWARRVVHVGPKEQRDYEHLLALLNVCHIDSLSLTEAELKRDLLYKALELYNEYSCDDDAGLPAIGQYALEWIQSWELK